MRNNIFSQFFFNNSHSAAKNENSILLSFTSLIFYFCKINFYCHIKVEFYLLIFHGQQFYKVYCFFMYFILFFLLSLLSRLSGFLLFTTHCIFFSFTVISFCFSFFIFRLLFCFFRLLFLIFFLVFWFFNSLINKIKFSSML